jgi:hypothetical protein
MGIFFSEIFQHLKKCLYQFQALSMSPCQSKRSYPNFVRILQNKIFTKQGASGNQHKKLNLLVFNIFKRRVTLNFT